MQEVPCSAAEGASLIRLPDFGARRVPGWICAYRDTCGVSRPGPFCLRCLRFTNDRPIFPLALLRAGV